MAFLYDFRLPTPLRKTLAALAPIVLTDEVTELGLTDAVVDHVELMMRAMPPHLRVGLVAGLTTFELGAMASPSALGRRFSSQPRAQQERYFRSYWHSRLMPLRQLAKGVKGLIALAYWEQPQILGRLAYHPDQWIAKVAARRLRDYAADIRAHEKLVLEPNPLIPSATLSRKRGQHEAA